MAIALVSIGLAFAAFCIWLTVRIVNRRERWAKWTPVSLLVLIAYCAGFGPACWLVDRGHLAARPAAIVYLPVLKFIHSDDVLGSKSPILWYAAIGTAYDPGWTITRMLDAAGQIGFATGVWPRDMRHGVPHRSNDVRF